MGAVIDAIGAALTLDRAGLRSVGLWAALGVALLAGASTMLGHLAILLLNRIRGLRLVATLLLNAIGIVALHTLQAALTWAVTSAALQRPLPLAPLITVGLVSVAPLIFNFLTAMPHFGLGLGRLLEGWAFLVLALGVSEVFEIGRWRAALFAAAGWLVVQLLSRLLQRPIGWAGSRLWTLASGQPTMVTARDILAGMPIMPVGDRRQGPRR